MITVRVHRSRGELVVAACDKELIGRTLREGQLRLEVSESFYQGEDADEELLVNRLNLATVANLVGPKTIGIAAKHRFIDDTHVLTIEGVPHAQMVRM
jgi:hypothetical protein